MLGTGSVSVNWKTSLVCPALIPEHLEKYGWFGVSHVSPHCGSTEQDQLRLSRRVTKWEVGLELWDWACSSAEVELQVGW